MLLKYGIIVYVGFFGSIALLGANESPSPNIRAQAAEVVALCEQWQQDAKSYKDLIAGIRRPQFPAKGKAKRLYKLKSWNLLAFDQNYNEFTRYIDTEKQKIRDAPAHDLQQRAMEFSSNCRRFATGLRKFAEWATKGTTGDQVYDSVAQEWLNYALCLKRKCD